MNLYELSVTLTLDKSEYEKKLNETENQTTTLGDKIKNGLGTAAKKVAKAGVAAAAAGATAIAKMVKDSVDAYAEYEQLAGGAELMFGDAYDYIMNKSKNAYSTVQMSQNAYLTQVNGFATGLKTALGGNEKAAAQLADKIVTAEADVVAATGATQENVQNAFNGIMKNNYTMLDNLQLGITPTKEGFQEVIDKVNGWNTAQGNASNYTIESLADCEAALVDYVAMVGMSGYANAEAAGTIQGSLAMTKSAYENFLTVIGNTNATTEDVTEAIDAMISSATLTITNILPVVESALGGIVTAIGAIAPQIVTMIPGMIQTILPGLLTGVVSIIQALAEVAPQIITTIMQVITENLPLLLTSALEIIMSLAVGIAQALPTLSAYIPQIINTIVTVIIQNLPLIISSAVQVVVALVTGLVKAIPQIVSAMPKLVRSIITGIAKVIPQMKTKGAEMMTALKNAIKNKISSIVSTVGSIKDKIKGKFTSLINAAKTWGRDFVTGFKNAISSKIQAVVSTVSGIASKIKSFLHFSRPDEGPLRDYEEWGRDFMEGYAASIRAGLPAIESAISDVTGSMTVSPTISGTARGASAQQSGNNYTINVYGTNSMDVNFLADEVASRITQIERRKGMAYA